MLSEMNIKQAETIVSEYGNLLSVTEPSLYGTPISLLPYDKEEIKAAIQCIILAVDKDDKKIQEGLTQAYVYLAQFIPDEKVKIAEYGRTILEKEPRSTEQKSHSYDDTEDLELANQAIQTINEIKTEMESLMKEISLLLT